MYDINAQKTTQQYQNRYKNKKQQELTRKKTKQQIIFIINIINYNLK